ncbi:MAG: hypothetical protein WC824_02880 [Bacteroidota bacterium]
MSRNLSVAPPTGLQSPYSFNAKELTIPPSGANPLHIATSPMANAPVPEFPQSR